ncbi:alcohol dehydrogenase catalytic domain-containing protein [Amycolatopsis circi]|uniref:alcohol dehydrogenase catalytic domain-containing protein n=1 Tax=Amycolatopsis circi TaxID=871959 RepID=UPI001ABF4040|nr:alcohol dehydrogenase catalytic domain-containing protein [Amycolatopsis circi]
MSVTQTPTSMRVVELVRFGAADAAFAARQLPSPVPGPGQVLVRVEAASVNPLDLQTRRGDYRDEVALPAVIGNDVSSVMVKTGSGADDFERATRSGTWHRCSPRRAPTPSITWSTRR